MNLNYVRYFSDAIDVNFIISNKTGFLSRANNHFTLTLLTKFWSQFVIQRLTIRRKLDIVFTARFYCLKFNSNMIQLAHIKNNLFYSGIDV